MLVRILLFGLGVVPLSIVFVSIYHFKISGVTGFHVSWDSLFDVVNVQHAGQLRNHGLIPERGKRFFSTQSLHL